MLAPWKESYDKPRQHIKSRDTTLPSKVHLVIAMVFPVVIYGYESWTIKKTAPTNWCFWTVVLEKTLESPLDSKEIQTVHSKGNQPWIFIGRTDGETEAPVLWPPDAKSWLTGKDPDAGKDWRPKETRAAEDGWLDSITDSMDMNLGKFQETVRDRQAWCVAVHGITELDTT